MTDQLNKGFRIPKKELDRRVGFTTQIPDDYTIVPLKQLVEAKDIKNMRTEEMEGFLRAIPIVGSPSIFPYRVADICAHQSGSNGLHVPQTFVLRRKLVSILEGLNGLYKGFEFPKLANRNAHYVMGENSSGDKVAGVYFPPLVEIVGHQSQALLIDGNHRMSICGIVGAPMETILIKNSPIRPPYEGVPWSDARFVDEKPALKDRYIKFNPAFLKDFEYVGIDG